MKRLLEEARALGVYIEDAYEWEEMWPLILIGRIEAAELLRDDQARRAARESRHAS